MTGWKVSKLNEIKPRKPEWPAGFHSIGYHFGITGFGVSGKTVDKGGMLTPLHDEVESGQQELFIIMTGSAEFELDGQKQIISAGQLVFCQPDVQRKADSLEDNTNMITVGGTSGKAYPKPDWA